MYLFNALLPSLPPLKNENVRHFFGGFIVLIDSYQLEDHLRHWPCEELVKRLNKMEPLFKQSRLNKNGFRQGSHERINIVFMNIGGKESKRCPSSAQFADQARVCWRCVAILRTYECHFAHDLTAAMEALLKQDMFRSRNIFKKT